MVKTLLIRVVWWIAGMALLLFVPAGTLDWPAAWVFIALMAATSTGTGVWLAQHDPELLAQRMASPIQPEQKTWDKLLIAVILATFCAWFVIMALDAARYHYSHVPFALKIAGALAITACMYFAYETFRENSFASPVVRIQRERGQKVIDTGPYAIVRHPMYSGALLYFIGAPLLLGSWIGLVLAPVLMVLLGVRTVLEERTLSAELDGYNDYTRRVRWRLVPRVW
jgi:protein-S-isoprenylcysteine O-methyltransferase Ste14